MYHIVTTSVIPCPVIKISLGTILNEALYFIMLLGLARAVAKFSLSIAVCAHRERVMSICH
jgi:hypothetical protein